MEGQGATKRYKALHQLHIAVLAAREATGELREDGKLHLQRWHTAEWGEMLPQPRALWLLLRNSWKEHHSKPNKEKSQKNSKRMIFYDPIRVLSLQGSQQISNWRWAISSGRRASEPWSVVHWLTESGRLQETNHLSGTTQGRREAESGQILKKKVL